MIQYFGIEISSIITGIDIAANIFTIFGGIVSIIALYIAVRQYKEKYDISKVITQKKLYDFFINFKDDWLFYIEYKKEIAPLDIALNGFEKDFLISNGTNHEEMILSLTRGYNSQIDFLNKMILYFKFSSKQKNMITEIIGNFKEYYRLLLRYYYINNTDNKDNEDEIINKMVDILKEIQCLLLDDITTDLIDKMEKSLHIYSL